MPSTSTTTTTTQPHNCTVFVTSATGSIGKATLKALCQSEQVQSGKVNVIAGSRKPDHRKEVAKDCGNIKLVKFDAADGAQSLASELKGVDAIFVIPPGAENRGDVALTHLNAAVTANVKHIVLLSMIANEYTGKHANALFGRQMRPVEERARSCGVPYTIMRLPIFLDTLCMFSHSIKKEGTITFGAQPDTKFNNISTKDVGEVAAHLLLEPNKFSGETLLLTGPKPFTMNEITKDFARASGRSSIGYNPVTPEKFQQMLVEEHKFQEWQAKGFCELLDAARDGQHARVTRDVERVIGRPAQPAQSWIEANAECFK